MRQNTERTVVAIYQTAKDAALLFDSVVVLPLDVYQVRHDPCNHQASMELLPPEMKANIREYLESVIDDLFIAIELFHRIPEFKNDRDWQALAWTEARRKLCLFFEKQRLWGDSRSSRQLDSMRPAGSPSPMGMTF